MVLPDIMCNARHSAIAESVYRCSLCKVYFTQGRREVGSSATLIFCCAPTSQINPLLSSLQSAAPVCRLPVCGSDLSGHGLVSAGGGRSNKETDYPRSTYKKLGGQTFTKQTLLQIPGHKLFLLIFSF